MTEKGTRRIEGWKEVGGREGEREERKKKGKGSRKKSRGTEKMGRHRRERKLIKIERSYGGSK